MDQYLISMIVLLITSTSAVISIVLAYFIYRIKRETAHIQKDIAERRGEVQDAKIKSYEYITNNIHLTSSEIGKIISDNLISEPSWLENYRAMAGSTYSGSIYGDRIKHFYYEKMKLAEHVINYIDSKVSNEKKACLLIDSGTTTYPLFIEISKLLQQSENKEKWIRNVYIITNNIPGIQYLMKYAKENPNNPYSEISIKCLLLPGKPLSVYAAITGNESGKWLDDIDSFLQEEWGCARKDFEIFGFITGNYISPDYNEKKDIIGFNPVARGEGHVEIKEIIAEKSDSIILISPLMKYSFADVDILNNVNGFKLDRFSEDAKTFPNKVKYEKISVDYEKCVFFTTKREKQDHFYKFYQDLEFDLNKVSAINGSTVFFIDDFKIRDRFPFYKEEHDRQTIEIESEIPHIILRDKYKIDSSDIWDKGWILDQLKKS